MVQLRDGKAYDPTAAEPAAGVSVTRTRRQSTSTTAAAAAAVASAQRVTRRSARLATTAHEVPEEAAGNGTPLQQRFEAASTPATRAKRARPVVVQQPAPAAAPAEDDGDDGDLLDEPDVGKYDQGLQEAADTELPADEPSPSQVHTSKKARHVDLPGSAAKAAAAASKLRKEMGTLSLAGASMVLVAALLIAALLPGAAPHRAALRGALRASALRADEALLRPARAHLSRGLSSAGAQLSAGRLAAAQLAGGAAAAGQRRLQAARRQLQDAGARVAASVRAAQLPPALRDAVDSARALLLSRRAPAAWSHGVLAGVLPATPHWSEWAADVSEVLRTAPEHRSHQAPAMVLACAVAGDCAAAAAALAALPPGGADCTLELDAAHALPEAEGAAALQAAVAPFLRRCPAGLVVLTGAEALPVTAVSALVNALSEQGGFSHDGPVPGGAAAYALLTRLPAERVAAAAAAADDGASGAIKEALFDALRQQLQAKMSATASAAMEAAAAQGQEDGEQLQQHGEAAAKAQWGPLSDALATLHRRILHAAPVRLGSGPAAAAAA